VIGGVRQKIEDGSPLGEAMAEYGDYFDAVYRSLISAGEAGGNLDVMLQRLAELTERQARTRSTVIGALTYPAVLVVLCLAVLGAVFSFVLPRFAGMFRSLEVPLPASTEVMLALSGVVRGYWWAMAIVVGLAGVGVVIGLRDAGNRRRAMDVVLRVPVIGKLLKDFALARIGASVPFLEALELTRSGVSNPAYRSLLDRAEKCVLDGDSVTHAFTDTSLVSPSFSEALRAGEQSGRIGPVLSKLADHMDLDNEQRLKTVTKLAEPAILALLGLVVGAVAVSLFLPLFDLTAMAGGGGG
jgi:type II secretory pathway component PulF